MPLPIKPHEWDSFFKVLKEVVNPADPNMGEDERYEELLDKANTRGVESELRELAERIPDFEELEDEDEE